MHITGKVHAAGDIVTCDNYPQEFHDDLNFGSVTGFIVEASEDELAKVSAILGATVIIRPARTDNAPPLAFTPENFDYLRHMHAAACDQLAAEVRSCKALQEQVAALEAEVAKTNAHLLQVQKSDDDRELAQALKAEVKRLQEREDNMDAVREDHERLVGSAPITGPDPVDDIEPGTMVQDAHGDLLVRFMDDYYDWVRIEDIWDSPQPRRTGNSGALAPFKIIDSGLTGRETIDELRAIWTAAVRTEIKEDAK